MQMKEYPLAEVISDENTFLISTEEGTKKAKIGDISGFQDVKPNSILYKDKFGNIRGSNSDEELDQLLNMYVGFNNEAISGAKQSIIHGRNNIVEYGTCDSCISSEDSIVTATNFSACISAKNCRNSSSHSIVSGTENTSSSSANSILSGNGNKISSTNSILSGNGNTFYSQNPMKFINTNNIVSGSGNNIGGSNNIISGHNVKLNSNYAYANNSIICGDDIQIELPVEDCIICGLNNSISQSFTDNKGKSTFCFGNDLRFKDGQMISGHYNDEENMTAGSNSGNSSNYTAFTIGNGNSSTRSNAVRIDYAGKVMGKQAYATTGADYAEYFEWEDGNPDLEKRSGLFVTLNGDKIKLANDGDYILGVISENPSVIGNFDMEWSGKFMKNEYNSFIKIFENETVEEVDPKTGEIIQKEISVETYMVNPGYDPNKSYIPRSDRPEWDAVGMFGVLVVRDDGSCQINGYCSCGAEGIATASDTGYRVIGRINENIVKIVLKG